MKLSPTLPYCALLVIGSVRALTATAAESQEFALQLVPTSVEIPYGGEATVLVVLQNTSAGLLDAAHISTFSNPLLQVKIEPTDSRPVPAHGIITWTAHVSTGKLKAASGSVYFRVDFTKPAKEGETPTPAVSLTEVAALTVTSQAPQSLADVVEVKTESTIESLNSKRPGILYLSFKSKTNVPITVGMATVKSPAWVQVNAMDTTAPKSSPTPGGPTAPGISGEFELLPYASRMVAYNVTAGVRVTPGKQLLVFEVPLRWEKGGLQQKATAIASQEVEVGVFGESEILTALAVPTFLFLPGFLIITTIGLLWKLGKPESEKDKFPLKGNAPDFYLVSISLSILIFIAYPWITGLRGVSRDLTEAYGLEDVVRVWFACVGVGLLVVGVYTGYEAIARYGRSLYEFSTSDDALTFLQKLGRKHMGIRFQKAGIGVPTKTEDAFVIADVPSQDGKSWVAPAIVMTWKPDSGEEQKAVAAAINNNDAAEVSRLLSAAGSMLVTLDFQPPGTTKAVRTVDNTTIGTRGPAESIIS
jgi:hypothetical protein